MRLGLVAYAGSAFLVQAPTFERASILEAIDRFQTQRGTNIGEGLLVSLQALFPEDRQRSLRNDPPALPVIPTIEHHEDASEIDTAEDLLRIAGPLGSTTSTWVSPPQANRAAPIPRPASRLAPGKVR